MAFIPYKDLKKNPMRLDAGSEMRVHSFAKKGVHFVKNAFAGAWTKIIDDDYHIVMPLRYYLPLLNVENAIRLGDYPRLQITFWIVSPSQPPFACVHEDGRIMTSPEAGERFVEEFLEAGPECSLHICLEFAGQIINTMPVIVLRKGADLRTEISRWTISCRPTHKRRSPKPNKTQSKRGSTRESTAHGKPARLSATSKAPTRAPRKPSVRTKKPTENS